MRYTFVSPHMDDVVLSAGNCILDLIKKKKKVLVTTVFTEFGKEPISLKSRRYLYDSGFFNLKQFIKARKKEDRQAMETLGAEYVHLGFIDGGFRKKENVNWFFELLSYLGIGKKFLYPAKLFSGKIFPEDELLIKMVYLELKKRVGANDVLLGPLAIGNHVDHLIVKEMLSFFPNKKYFWIDQPYVDERGGYKQLRATQRKFKKAFSAESKPLKKEIVSCYRSQIECLFPDGIKLKKETFYEEKN